MTRFGFEASSLNFNKCGELTSTHFEHGSEIYEISGVMVSDRLRRTKTRVFIENWYCVYLCFRLPFAQRKRTEELFQLARSSAVCSD